MASDLHSETKGSWFESGCYLGAVVSSLQYWSSQCLSVCEAGGNGSEKLEKCPPPPRAFLWYVNGREKNSDRKKYIYQLLGPNLSQNQKCSEFIKISPNWYFKYADFDFKVKKIKNKKNKKKIKYLPPARPKLFPKIKTLRIHWNLAHLIFQIYRFQL